MPVTVEGLDDVVRVWSGLSGPVRRIVYGETVNTFRPQWVRGIKGGMRNRRFPQLEALTRTGVTFTLGNNGPTGNVFQSNRRHSGGMVASSKGDDGYGPWEFGTKAPTSVSKYTRKSKKGGTHTVERRIRKNLPRFKEEGYVVFPLVAELAPDIVSYWTASIVRAAYDWQRT
jgi:hypothetical protein